MHIKSNCSLEIQSWMHHFCFCIWKGIMLAASMRSFMKIPILVLKTQGKVYNTPANSPNGSDNDWKKCWDDLRVRAFFHKTVRVCHVYCNFKICFTCRITVIFGTLKDGSLLINTLASNICFSYRNMFQNGVDTLSKIVDAFLSKSSKFHLIRIIR